jgi:Ca-activated chloride channel family protein
VLVTVTAPQVPRVERLPVCLALVLDRSGSMGGDKIRLAREATVAAIRSLASTDSFAVVAFDDVVELVVPLTRASSEGKREAASRVLRIEARGSTDLAGGWLRGAEQVGLGLVVTPDALGRVLLLTDGLANAGLQDPHEILRHVGALRTRRVGTTTIGVGEDFAEQMLGSMADTGGGHFYYVQRDEEIPATVAAEVGETLDVVARDVRLLLRADGPFGAVPQNPYPMTEEEGTYALQLGDLVSDQQITLALALDLPAGEIGKATTLRFELSDRDGTLEPEGTSVPFTRATAEDEASERPDQQVVRLVEGFSASRTRQQAVALNSLGARQEAVALLLAEAARIRAVAAGDEELTRLALGLEDCAEDCRHQLPQAMAKLFYKRASDHLKSRSAQGLAERVGRVPVGDRPVVVVSSTGYGRNDPGLERVLIEALSTRFAQSLDLIHARGVTSLTGFNNEEGDELPEAAERRTVEALAKYLIPPEALRINFTPGRLSDNFFSHWHPGSNVAIVSFANWDLTASVPLAAFVAYELLIQGLRALAPAYDPMALFHDETRGCLFDFCRDRREVEIKLQAADLCPSCRQHLTEAGLDLTMVEEFAERIRQLAAPDALLRSARSA